MNWKEIWNKRKLNTDDSDVLTILLKADGYDSGAGLMSTHIIKSCSEYIIKKMSIAPGDSVFEVGCGGGAMLFHLEQNGILINGCDYSESLIKIANTYLKGKFFVGSADELNTDIKYDHVFSVGVFHYFPSYDYALAVIKKMLECSKNSIAIIDIPDKSKQIESESKRRSVDSNYDVKYNGLDHLYYEKEWWNNIAKYLKCNIIIENQPSTEYKNAEFRFNVFLKKY